MLIQRIVSAVLGAALYLCTGAFGDEPLEIPGSIGSEANFLMTDPMNAARCTVTSNTDVEFSLVPLDPDIPSGIARGIMDEMYGTCGMSILSSTLAHAGVWTIRAYLELDDEEPNVTKQFRLSFVEGESEHEEETPTKVAQMVDVFPSRLISIFPGNSMTLRLVNHYENLTSCIATSPDGQKFDVLNTVNELSGDIRSFGQCGVTVRVADSHGGTWQLDAMVQNDEMEEQHYYGNFYVVVRDSNTIDTETAVTHVQRGAPASISFGPSEAISCQLRNPRGQILPVQSGNCQIDIPTVTNMHEGFWSASYSLHGEVNSVEKVTEIVAYDDHKLNATVTRMDNGEINLLCSVRSYSFSYCQFVKPDGMVLNVFEGIGNDRYLYYGQGTQSTSMLTERTHDCGITILKPEHSDVGSWKCVLGTSSGLTGSLLSVDVPGTIAYENADALLFRDTVYVVKGNSFTVKCNANAPLKYCWMSSPNGTAYSVSSSQSSPGTLLYDGMGMTFGECGAVISAAKDTDVGEWKCGMGVSDGREIISTVPVIVTDTLLSASMKNVTVLHDTVQLSCSLIPGHEESIDYCRWIRPGGSSIGHWNGPNYLQPEYITSNTYTSCHLEIQIVKRRLDLGHWTCIAGLVGSSVEVSDTILVRRDWNRSRNSHGFRFWCTGLGLAMLSTLVAVILICTIRNKFRPNPRRDLPPKYEEHHTGLPPAMTPYAQTRP